MIREEIYARLNKIFREIFDDESICVQDSTTSDDIEGWDSLEQINLVVAVENEFGMKFRMDEVVSMENVGKMVDIIVERMSA